MGVSYKSQVVQPAQWKDPISESMLAQGFQAQEQRLEKSTEDAKNMIDNIMGIPALQGKDTETKNEIIRSLKSHITELSYKDLTDPNVSSSLQSYIQQVAQSPDIQGIAQRATLFNNELKAKEEAESKGQTYISPILDDAMDYMNSGVYERNKKFTQPGWVDPGINKLKLEALKDVPKVTDWNVGSDGYLRKTEKYDDEALSNAIANIYMNPNVQKTIRYNWDKTHGNQDWGTIGMAHIQSKISDAQQAAFAANSLLSVDPTNEEARKTLADSKDFISTYSSLLSDPTNTGEQLKELSYQEYLNNLISNDIKGSNYFSVSDLKADEFRMKALEHQNRLGEIAYSKKLETELNSNKDLSELQKEAYKAALNSGQNIYNSEGQLIPLQNLSINPIESRDGEISSNASSSTKFTPDPISKKVSKDEALSTGDVNDIKSKISHNRQLLGLEDDDKISDVITYTTDESYGLKKIKYRVGNTPKDLIIITDYSEYPKLKSGTPFLDMDGIIKVAN